MTPLNYKFLRHSCFVCGRHSHKGRHCTRLKSIACGVREGERLRERLTNAKNFVGAAQLLDSGGQRPNKAATAEMAAVVGRSYAGQPALRRTDKLVRPATKSLLTSSATSLSASHTSRAMTNRPPPNCYQSLLNSC